MEQQIRQMWPGRVGGIKQFGIQHQGQPGQWVPVAGLTGGESPGDIVRLQAGLDMWIGSKVIRVVVVDEVTLRHRPKNQQRRSEKQQAKKNLFGKYP